MSEPKKKPTWAEVPPIEEVFANLRSGKLPKDFLQTDVDRDRRPDQPRPELDKMFDESVEEPEP